MNNKDLNAAYALLGIMPPDLTYVQKAAWIKKHPHTVLKGATA